jgi:putative membrane protein insertion efficiency factor
VEVAAVVTGEGHANREGQPARTDLQPARGRGQCPPPPGRVARRRPGPAGRGLIFLVRLYQASLSRWLGGQCRFVPTCSQYCIEAVRAKGAIRGGLKGLWRVLRCHPFSRGGYDPVD